jgi:hypothetical protein
MLKESDSTEMLLVGVKQRQERFDTDGQARRIVSALLVYFGPLLSSSVLFGRDAPTGLFLCLLMVRRGEVR